jgi:RNA polymerase sigma factor (sigma-70 family)
VQDDGSSRFDLHREASDDAVREIAVRVAHRRMFSDLSETERQELVDIALEAHASAWGPPGRPDDVEAWLASGMYHAMMHDFRERRMLRRPFRPGGPTRLDSQLEEWLSAGPSPAGGDLPSVDGELTDRFLRQLSPADARLLWMQCEGYTREQIADLLGIRPNAVSVRLRRLQIRLREALEPVTDTAPPADERQGKGHGVA